MIINDIDFRFEHPEYVYRNVVEATERNNYNHLERAIRRTYYNKPICLRKEDSFSCKCDYYIYPKNLLVITSKDDEKIVFQPFLNGKVAEIISEFDEEKLKSFFKKAKDNVMIIDNIGREYNFTDFNGLKTYIEFLEKVKRETESRREDFHNVMDKFNDLKDYANFHPNENTLEVYKYISSECYDILSILSNLSHSIYYENEKYELDFFEKPTQNEKLAKIMGLYISCLKDYNLRPSSIGESGSFDEAVFIGFMHELNDFLLLNPDVLNIYAEYFDLKPCEKTIIENLLKTEKLNDSEWEQFNQAKNVLED